MTDILNTISCTPKEPFIKLEENGQAPILKYSLPQSHSYDAYSQLELEMDTASFKSDLPTDPFWENTENLTLTEILLKLLDEVDRVAINSLFENNNLLYLNGVIEKGPKRLLDYLSVDSQIIASTPNSDAARSSAFRIIDEAAIPLIPTDDFFGDNNASTNGGSTSSSNNSSTNYTIGSYSSSLNVNTDAVPPRNLLLQLGDLNLDNLANDIPSIHILRLYKIAGIPIFEIAMKINRGFKPVLIQDTFGDVHLEFLPKIENPIPKLNLVLHFKMQSFLGNYGAGKIIKTISLLPGEKQNITIRNWKRNETTKKKAENVLDSFSEDSANDLQNIIENENTDVNSSSQSDTTVKTKKKGGGLNLGIFKIGGGGSTTSTKTFNSASASQVRNLSNSTAKQSSKSNSLREVEINTETTEITQNEQEETIVRTLENINQSRVLNFTFRQLLQEYISVTYLDQVTFLFTNGYYSRSATLAELDQLLNTVLTPTAFTEVRNTILSYLSHVKDYQGTSVQFAEKVTEIYSNLIDNAGPPLEASYLRKRTEISYPIANMQIEGVVYDVAYHSLRTDALIADALLGQGEALDCYNIKLQNESVQEAILNNNAKQQAITILDGISDPIKKAELFKKVNGDCCDVPQSGNYIIGGNNSNEGIGSWIISNDFQIQ
jgi:hypothetical protein